jgi:hypothetical protein
MDIFKRLDEQIGSVVKQYSDRWKEASELKEELQKQIELYENKSDDYDPEYAQIIIMKLLVSVVSNLDPSGIK